MRTDLMVLGQAKSLRGSQTSAEQILWRKLRAKHFHNIKFKRQVPLGPYIADFCCKELKLVIEVDSWSHWFKREKDDERDRFLYEEGYRVLRFSNKQIKKSVGDVLKKIEEELGIAPIPEGEGC